MARRGDREVGGVVEARGGREAGTEEGGEATEGGEGGEGGGGGEEAEGEAGKTERGLVRFPKRMTMVMFQWRGRDGEFHVHCLAL